MPWRRKWQPTLALLPGKFPWTEEPGGLLCPWGHKESDMTKRLHFLGPGSLDGKASACNMGDLGSLSGSGRSPGEGNSNPLKY